MNVGKSLFGTKPPEPVISDSAIDLGSLDNSVAEQHPETNETIQEGVGSPTVSGADCELSESEPTVEKLVMNGTMLLIPRNSR